jgi:hypothetical protein
MFTPGNGGATVKLFVANTTVLNNATGIWIKPSGGPAANFELKSLTVSGNAGDGLRVDGTGGSGATNLTIADSALSLNLSNGIDALSGPGSVTANIMSVVASTNGTGILSNQTSGGTATVTVGNSVLYGNGSGMQATGGGILFSYSNNQVAGNGTNGSFTGTAVLR